MIKTNKTYDHLLICSDIHSNIDIIPNYVRDMELKNCAIIQVGDFGMGFDRRFKEDKRMKYLNDRLINSNSDLFVLRGNHDNPAYFDGEYKLSNLTLLKDYSVVVINGINILCVGGAYSVDRVGRLGYMDKRRKFDYWVDEPFVFDEEKIKSFRNINIVCTHSSPNFCMPLSKSGLKEFMLKDPKIGDDVTTERHELAVMYNILSENNDISDWYNGHFHKPFTSYMDNTTFHSLEINKLTNNNLIY